jgi:CYTH domain-containing protein
MSNPGGLEIERRWLMAGFPEQLPEGLPTGVTFLCEIQKAQGYVSTAPVVRIRSEVTAAQGDFPAKEEYILCIKGKGRLARTEIETPLSAEVFEQLREFIGVPLVRKQTRLYRLTDGRTMECSLVDGDEPTAFYYAEVEFSTLDEATLFAAPDWFGEEKTMDGSFSMSAYWKQKCAAYTNANEPDAKEAP